MAPPYGTSAGSQAAFAPQGQTVAVATSGSINTSQSAAVDLADFNVTAPFPCLRMVNNGTVDIWVYLSATTQTAAFPTAGTTDASWVPQPGFRLKPGIVEVFDITRLWAPNPENVTPPVPGFFVNTIASVASQPFDMTPGEGL